MELRRTALRSDSRGTSSGTNDCQAEMFSPPAVPLTIRRPARRHGVAASATHSNHRRTATTIETDCVQKMIRLRSKRSASVPASGPTSSPGTNVNTAPAPTHVFECVSSNST